MPSQAEGRGRAGGGDQKRGLEMFRRSNPPDPADGLEVKGDPWVSGCPCWMTFGGVEGGGGDQGRSSSEVREDVIWVLAR